MVVTAETLRNQICTNIAVWSSFTSCVHNVLGLCIFSVCVFNISVMFFTKCRHDTGKHEKHSSMKVIVNVQ